MTGCLLAACVYACLPHDGPLGPMRLSVIGAASAQEPPRIPDRNAIGKNLETFRPDARSYEFGGSGGDGIPSDPERKAGGGAPAFTGGQQVIKPVAPGELLRGLQDPEEDTGSAGGLSGQSSGTSQPDTADRRGGGKSNKSRDSKDSEPGHLGIDKPLDLDFQNQDWSAYLSDGDAASPMSTTSGGTYGGVGGNDGGFKPTSTGTGGVTTQQAPSEEQSGAKPDTPASQSGGRGSNTGDGSAVLLRPGEYMRHEVLAVDLTPEGIARVRALGFTATETLDGEAGDPVITTLTAPKGMDTLAALTRLRKELPGKHFHPNRLYRLYRPSTKDDSSQDQPMEGGRGKCADDRCYARQAIGWNDGVARCAHGQRIGIIDTEADLRHPAFAGQSISQKSFLPPGAQASPSWHGTGILGLLAGRPDSATPGLIPEATFFTASIFFADEDGGAITSTVSLLRALDWLRASGAKLVNMSFSGPPDDLLRTRIADMSRDGFIFVAAAGNEGPTADPSYPAAYPQVIAITAVTSKLQVYPAANRGTYIDLAAPGVRIWTAAPGARQGYRSGTSFAAPFAIAVLALQRPETLQPPKERLLEQVKTVMLGSAAGRNAIYGRGLLQAPRECPNAGDAVTTSFTPPLPAPAKR